MADIPHPLLRNREKDTATVSYSELLFDLIYVFSVTQLSHFLLHNLTWDGLLRETILWFGVWMLWQHTIWVTNWFNPDTRQIRVLLFISMLIGLVMAAAIPDAFSSRGLVFAICYVFIQAGRTLFVILVLGGDHNLTTNFKRILGWFCISGIFWITGALVGGEWQIVLWIIAAISDYIAPMHGFALPYLGRSVSREEWQIEGHHLVERCQLFVIIAFGETLLMIGDSLTEMEEWTPTVVASAVISFVGSLAMWWIYFDVSSEAGSQRIREVEDPGKLGLIYNAIHIVLIGAIIICAVGDELVVTVPGEDAGVEVDLVLTVGPIIYLLANSVYKYITCHIIPLSHIIAIGAFVLLTLFSQHIHFLMLNILNTSVFVFVIVFDLIYSERACKIKR